jgi:endonuclease YncB( thermonuclease family)
MRWLALGLVFATCCASAQQEQLIGVVTDISEGDTMLIRDVSNRKHRIRLADVAAPESKRQPGGKKSRESLAGLCYQREATVSIQGTDPDGKLTIGRVKCAGVDVNAEQVRRGMVWVLQRDAKDSTLQAIQEEARASRRGLWADPDPVAPWAWRESKKR